MYNVICFKVLAEREVRSLPITFWEIIVKIAESNRLNLYTTKTL